MVRVLGAYKRLRLAGCGGLLVALAACASAGKSPTLSQQEAGPRLNVAMHAEPQLRDRAERVFARLVQANADVCRPFIIRRNDGGGDPAWQCDQRLIVTDDNALNASATPNVVTVSIGMLRFLRGDDDLAFILAHEMSHNLIEQATWREAGRGSLKADLVAARTDFAEDRLLEPTRSREVEAAADYLGVYLAARAGFAMDRASLLMRGLSALDPQSAPAPDEAHPPIVRRYLAIEQALREIAAKQAAGLPLIPSRLPRRR
jgi:Zn-dependent protease with chaperone function